MEILELKAQLNNSLERFNSILEITVTLECSTEITQPEEREKTEEKWTLTTHETVSSSLMYVIRIQKEKTKREKIMKKI